MNTTKPIELIQRYFPYLLDDFGFKVTDEKVYESFGNWSIVLMSDIYCRIRLVHDRGAIYVSFGTHWPYPGWEAGPWYKISVVLIALGGSVNELPGLMGSINDQLEILSTVIEPIIPKTSLLFGSKNYEKNMKNLARIQKKIEITEWISLKIRNHLVQLLFIFGVINTISVLGSSHAELIVGFFVAWVDFSIIDTLFSEERVKYLIIAALINTSTTYILLSISCIFLRNVACQRSPIVLSLIPGIILVTYTFLLALNEYFISKRGLNKLNK